MKNYLLFAVFLGIFLFLSITVMKEGMPASKNERVYKIVQNYMPYYLEKRVGGYSIVHKETKIKEKPPAKELFIRLEQLEKQWAKKFLKLENSTLYILNEKDEKIKGIQLKNKDEIIWVKNYFNLKDLNEKEIK